MLDNEPQYIVLWYRVIVCKYEDTPSIWALARSQRSFLLRYSLEYSESTLTIRLLKDLCCSFAICSKLDFNSFSITIVVLVLFFAISPAAIMHLLFEIS